MNGNRNGAAAASILDNNTIDALMSQDITTPGYIRLPVCGYNEAVINWARANTSYDNYPCNP